MTSALDIIARRAIADFDNFCDAVDSLQKLFEDTGDIEILNVLDRIMTSYRQKSFKGAPASANNADAPAVLSGAPASENNHPPQDPEPNYYAPMKNISVFLCGDWFDGVSSNKKKYTKEWREAIMEALLASEYKDGIALDWLNPKKRVQMKCEIVGILIDAGVIKGSYRLVAAAMNLGDLKPESLARYMSNAVKQPYYEWLQAFTKN